MSLGCGNKNAARSTGATVTFVSLAIYEMPDGSLRISTLRPTRLADLLGEPSLFAIAATVEKALEEVLAAAAK